MQILSERDRRFRAEAAGRLISHLSVQPNGCVHYTGGLNSHGYGIAAVGGVQVRAHRWIYEALVGPIPEGKVLCHICDDRRCVNPAHLFVGSQADNIADCVSKGRNASGSRVGSAKLNEDRVREIRNAEGIIDSRLAERYGVSRRLIRMVRRREIWRHVV